MGFVEIRPFLVTLLVLQHGFLMAAAFREFRVSTSEELQHTLDNALPDDQIILSAGIYHGPFTISRSGKEGQQIQLSTFDRDRVRIVGNGNEPAICVGGNYWYLSDLNIFNNNSIGMVIEGANNIVSSFKITKVDTAIQVTGAGNIVENCYIYKANTGIDLQANGTSLVNNRFYEKDVTCVRMRKDTCCGKLIGNICLFGQDVDDGKDYVVLGGTSAKLPPV